MFRSRICAIPIFLSLACTLLPAQSDSSAPATQSAQASSDIPTFRSTVRRVVVDVVVRDQNNMAVHGLAAKDFVLTEDGRPQNILSFDVHEFDTPSISIPPNTHLPTNNFVNIPPVPERGPLYVILYDLVNIEIADQPDARRQVMNFIKKKPDGTRFALFVHSDTLALVQGFTDDKSLLYAALDPSHPKPHVPMVFMMGKNLGFGDPVSTMNILTQVTQFLEGVPGHKNLIWLAGTFPLALAPRREDPREYEDDIKAELNVLTRAEVAIYPINVGGVPVNPPGQLTGARPNGGAASQTATAGAQMTAAGATGQHPTSGLGELGSGGQADAAGMVQVMQTESTFDSAITDYMVQKAIAEATGGRAWWSTNDITGALEEATEVDGNYYELTYSPTNTSDEGRRRSIRVKLDQKGYQLAYRRFYFMGAYSARPQLSKDQPAAASVATAENDTLQPNMKHGAPMLHDLLFSAHVRADGIPAKATAEQMAQLAEQPGYAGTRKKDKPMSSVDVQKYLVDYRVTDKALVSKAAGSKPAQFEFAAAAFDDDSRMLNGVINNASGETSVNPETSKSGVFRVRQEIYVPAAASWIRIGVRDKSSNRVGTLEVHLPLAPETPIPATTSAR
ncbi:MAG TPA: VWA domain-containing protein [Candidatus Sulfotelmatobacter sp.]|jgi:VWFA-related protein